ncbi:DUF3054 domain-containing protein [Gorillibacterium sp. sgz5001074]|uniref:DUF3054 domain-containing protein n=1 Tax=Gorillibacterium sp. sgz5001074 TaxID=3446695 RepID=UPI003F660D5C
MTKRFENQVFIFAAMLLAVGDVLALLLFTFFGTMEHQMDSGFREIWNITLPFIIAWLLAGLLTGAYRSKAYAAMSQAASSTLKTAVLGMPIGLLLRWFLYDKPATWTFVIVAFVFVLLFLLLWRWAFTWLIRNI